MIECKPFTLEDAQNYLSDNDMLRRVASYYAYGHDEYVIARIECMPIAIATRNIRKASAWINNRKEAEANAGELVEYTGDKDELINEVAFIRVGEIHRQATVLNYIESEQVWEVMLFGSLKICRESKVYVSKSGQNGECTDGQ